MSPVRFFFVRDGRDGVCNVQCSGCLVYFLDFSLQSGFQHGEIGFGGWVWGFGVKGLGVKREGLGIQVLGLGFEG